jgi:uroporphyrinogen decarboxylase
MRKLTATRLIAASLLFAAAAASGQNAGAQSYSDYNKRELLYQVLDQSRPNDYVPVFFNIHFAEHSGEKAVQAHIDFFRTTHVDFVNVKYEYFPKIQTVKTPADWNNVKPFDNSEWDEQLNVVRRLKQELGAEALIIPTVFSPVRVLIQTVGAQLSKDVAGRKAVVELIKKDPEAAKPALEAVTKSLVYYIREARKAGADGFYISSQGNSVEEFGDGVFRNIIKQYDRQLADAASSIAPYNILHICESGGHFTPETFNDYLDYPGSVVNPPLHCWKDSKKQLSLKQISSLFKRPVLGGIDNRGVIYSGTLEEAKAEVDKILRNAPDNIIIGADDSLPNDIDLEKVRKLVDYIHTWRQTHPAK